MSKTLISLAHRIGPETPWGPMHRFVFQIASTYHEYFHPPQKQVECRLGAQCPRLSIDARDNHECQYCNMWGFEMVDDYSQIPPPPEFPKELAEELMQVWNRYWESQYAENFELVSPE